MLGLHRLGVCLDQNPLGRKDISYQVSWIDNKGIVMRVEGMIFNENFYSAHIFGDDMIINL